MLRDLFFQSATPIIRLGRTRPLTPEDAPLLPQGLHPEEAAPAFASLPTDSFRRFVLSVFWATGRPARTVLAIIMMRIAVVLTTPVLLHSMLSQLPTVSASRDLPVAAMTTAVVLGLVGILGALLNQHMFFNMLRGFATIVNGLNDRIIHHALKLRRSSRSTMQTGDLVNHLSSDTDAMAESMFFIPEFYNTIIETVAVMAMLWWYLGVAALASFATLALIAPLTVLVANRYRRLDHELMELRDERVTLMSQILQGIRVVKFHAWEHSVRQEVSSVRHREVATKVRIVRTDALSTMIFVSTTTLVGFSGFGAYVYLGGELTTPLIFACLALFAMLEEPFGIVSHLLSNLQHARVATGRLHRFFTASVRPQDERSESDPFVPVGLVASNLSLTYPDAGESALQELDLDIAPGASIAIIGTVGAGKSTLLRTLAGLHVPTTGSVVATNISPAERPRIGYVPQEAFIMNASVEENILFGEDIDHERLNGAIHDSALDADLRLMPAGRATEIGERGVNLSGGQKQRVSLARAAYYRPGLVLLDDPLSAVDVHTEEVLVDSLLFGAWKNITRVVVTHRLAHVHRFDMIILMEKGSVIARGTFDELQHHEAFRDLMRHEAAEPPNMMTSEKSALKDAVPAPSASAATDDSTSRLTVDEDRVTGAVGVEVYKTYLRAMVGRRWSAPLWAMGLVVTVLMISFMPILQTSWLGHWSDVNAGRTSTDIWSSILSVTHTDTLSAPVAIIIYGVLGTVVLLAWGIERLTWLSRTAAASRTIHDDALLGVLQAPLRFFDSTPMGRILNRFARDMEGVDDHLSWNIEQSFKALTQTLSSILLIMSVLPLIIVVIIPVFWLYNRLQRDYRKSAREAKRLESISRSSRYSHFKELVTGLDVIHGFAREQHFIDTHRAILGRYQRAYWCSIMLNRWFSTRVPMTGGLVAVGTSVLIIMSAWNGAISPGLAGVVMTYAISFWATLNWTIRAFSEVESRMTSVERLETFATLPGEPPTTSLPALDAAALWPSKGAVRIEDLHVRYAEHLPTVLHGVSFSVEPAMNVGIIGRTGSGKSTLFQTLFRFVEPERGRIMIDGVDITSVPLERLRRSIAIIPQDPTLFIGTVRLNLDRFSECTDAEIWEALRRVQLAGLIRDLPGGLHAPVVEGGANFSQGQRQLLCLARAILIRARIIVLDEATASVDIATDALIQRTIREEFRDVTVLTIAHRLDTVADADMIVELSAGRVSNITR
ncbi:MAG: ATP-binding cassette domain-containing protein [Candidatus Kapabacteria bacterium]|nr:ATP-binding cassette domain-containing protein [Candidatus Kapabacteria bacterium]